MKTAKHWNRKVLHDSDIYLKFHEYWLSEQKAEVFVLLYEDLKKNLAQKLKDMSQFLNMEASNDVINCVVNNSEGKFSS